MEIRKIVLRASLIFVIFPMAQCGEVQCQERSVNPGTLNWDQTTEDYSKYRPGYPDSYFLLLQELGIGLSFNWVRDADAITQQTGELLKKYGSEQKHQRRREAGCIIPEWAKDKFRLKTYHTYYVTISFTKESWRGRIRASRSVGAILSREKVEEFDRELQKLLDDMGEDHFDVKHRITFYIFELKS